MGWNTGYTIFEATVVGAYDLGKLDADLLTVLMEPYRGTDIDSGGSHDLMAKDGLDVVDIVLKTFGEPSPAKPGLATCADEESEAYWEAKAEAFYRVRKRFGWW